MPSGPRATAGFSGVCLELIPMIIDTHAHLSDPCFDQDREDVIQRAIPARICRLFFYLNLRAHWVVLVQSKESGSQYERAVSLVQRVGAECEPRMTASQRAARFQGYFKALMRAMATHNHTTG